MNHIEWLQKHCPDTLPETEAGLVALLQRAQKESQKHRYFINAVVLLIIANIVFLALLPTLVAPLSQSWLAWLVFVGLLLGANLVNQALENRLIRQKMKTLLDAQQVTS